MNATYFQDFRAFYEWMQDHHDQESELWVGFYKKGTGKPSITWPESVDVGLCFGWIDGIRKSVDGERYKIRFTPRTSTSHWSAVNLKRFEELKASGLVQPAGIIAYQNRKEKNTRQASYEQESVAFKPDYLSEFKQHDTAWKDFQSRPPSYRKQCTWWVMSAKREDTRLRRLRTLIESSTHGELIPPLRWTVKKK